MENSSLIFGGVALGVGVLAYQKGWLHFGDAVAVAGGGSGAPTPIPIATLPPSQTTFPTQTTQLPVVQTPIVDPVVGKLAAAAAGDGFFVNGQSNADHWAFYFNQLYAPLSGAEFTAAFGADRGPALMTATQFVTAVRRVRPSGLSGCEGTRIPAWLLLGNRGVRGLGLALLQPSTDVVSSSMINWAGPPVTVPAADSFVEQMVQSLENDVRYKLQSGGTVLDPAACQAKMAGELASQCSIYPGTCAGQNTQAIIADACGHYGDYLSDQQASMPGVQTNYVAPVHDYPIYTEGQAIQYFTPTPTASGGMKMNAPTQTPPTQNTIQLLTSAPPPPVQSTAQQNAQATAAVQQQQAATSPASTSGPSQFLSSTVDVGGYSIPMWAIAAVVVGGAFFMMQRR